jgi:hypothetical protein
VNLSNPSTFIVPLHKAAPFQGQLSGAIVVSTIKTLVNELSGTPGFGELQFVANYQYTRQGPAVEIGVYSPDANSHLRFTPNSEFELFCEDMSYDQIMITYHAWHTDLPLNSTDSTPCGTFYAVAVFFGELVKWLKVCDGNAFPLPIFMTDLMDGAPHMADIITAHSVTTSLRG